MLSYLPSSTQGMDILYTVMYNNITCKAITHLRGCQLFFLLHLQRWGVANIKSSLQMSNTDNSKIS